MEVLQVLGKRKKNQIGGIRRTALGGAKLADDETEDENDSFGFLIRDMKPEYWYLRRWFSLKI